MQPKIINPKAIFESEEDGSTYMHLNFTTIDKETGDMIIHDIPRIVLDTTTLSYSEPEVYYWNSEPKLLRSGRPSVSFFLDTSYGNEGYYTQQLIKKERELTIEEIEKELGYPIKIVK